MARVIQWVGSDSISTAATVTSSPMVLKATTYEAALQYVWTGTTAGLIQPQISLDGSNWSSLAAAFAFTGYGEASPAGSPGSALLAVSAPAVYLRVVFTRSGGTGLLTARVHEVHK